MLKTRALILAKIEATYGTDPVPTAAANAILCEAPEIEVLGKALERGNVKTYFGANSKVNLGEGIKIGFTTEVKGSGTAGTAPEIGVLFRACNFTQTVIVTPAEIYYSPNSSQAGESVTIYFYQHDILHKVVGCRGSFSFELKTNEYGKIKWDFQGLYAGPIDATIATGTFNATLPPIFRSASFAINSYSAIIESLKIDIKNEIAKRPSANAATGILEYFIKGRAVGGECDPEVVALATKSFWAMWENSSQVALTATLGSAAGNKVITTAPKVQVDIPKYAERESILTHSLPMVLVPNTGNDEIKISFQ